MKRLALILGFVVFWRQWEIEQPSGWVATTEYREPTLVPESKLFESREDVQEFIHHHSKDERYTDMHIYRIGEEVR